VEEQQGVPFNWVGEQQGVPFNWVGEQQGVPFDWVEEQAAFFNTLNKTDFHEAPVLQVPDFEKDFVLITDANYIAVLNHRVIGEIALIAFYSELLGPEGKAMANYS
jgi:hypothetical protein